MCEREVTILTGYAGTPLLKKLGFKSPLTVCVLDAPIDYKIWLEALPDGLTLETLITPTVEAAHLFLTERAALEDQLLSLRSRLVQGGFIWVSWPKKASKVTTDITEDVIRELALPMGYVDIKVCSVSEIWSGLKLVIRKSNRTASKL
jgi:Protein of unknown function (DUF3052)